MLRGTVFSSHCGSREDEQNQKIHILNHLIKVMLCISHLAKEILANPLNHFPFAEGFWIQTIFSLLSDDACTHHSRQTGTPLSHHTEEGMVSPTVCSSCQHNASHLDL